MDIDETDDFGFTTHSKDELIDTTTDQLKAHQMFNAIVPLLNNLLKDADTNDIIKWPNRRERIEQFIKQLEDILTS